MDFSLLVLIAMTIAYVSEYFVTLGLKSELSYGMIPLCNSF